MTEVKMLARHIPEGLPDGLRNYWYPVLQSEELPEGKAVAVKVLGEALAVWRNAEGKPNVVKDRCPHRSIKLSVGRVLGGELQCLMHGLRFNGEGKCTLIPWESDASRMPSKLTAYPAQELGGYVWAYIGDTVSFPPPPLETQVPEELLKPDEFICFRLRTEIWKSNWLLAIDGSDGFHAVVLHTDSQAVNRVAGASGPQAQDEVPLEDRRIKIIKTAHGIRGVSVDMEGKSINHGHFTVDVKGERFCLPCLTTNPIIPKPGVAPYASRLWQFPQDEGHTMVVRYLAWRAPDQAARDEAARIFNSVAAARLNQVNAEDAFAAEAMGDVIEARSSECLLAPDEDVIKVRRMLHQAFMAQAGKKERIDVPQAALAYPT